MAGEWVVLNGVAEGDEDANPEYPWYPYLFTSDGVGLGPLNTYFATEAECRTFIQDYVSGAVMEAKP